jgi:Mg-chelatase subunit ChlD
MAGEERLTRFCAKFAQNWTDRKRRIEMSNKFNISVLTDFQQIPADKPFTMRVMLTAEGTAEPKAEKKRQPLHIALVLDRSGSMSGSKLSHVKKAVLELVKLLEPEDVISLTVFDDQVNVIIDPTRVDCLENINQAVARIHSGGCTNLHGGYRQGCDLAIEHADSASLKRVILMTDGLANEGLTDPDALADFAAKMQEQGITTTTIGVGSGYNEFLLGKIAENGGGGSYFIERPEDAVPVFTGEMKNLKSVVASDLKVSINTVLPGAEFKQMNTYRKLSEEEYLLGDVYSGQPRRILFEARIPASPAGQELELVSIRASWKEEGEEGSRSRQKTNKVKVTPVEAKAFAKVKGDRKVLLEGAFLSIAWANRKAIDLSDQGRFEEAAKAMKKTAAKLEKMELGDANLTREIEDLKTRAEELGNRGEEFYSPVERKRMYHEHQMIATSNPSSMFAMKERRILVDDYPDMGPSFRYTCYEVDGHVLAEIGNERVLIDTGGAVSIGRRPSLLLGEKDFPLLTNLPGVDIREISRLIGTRITALVGADILNQLNFVIDLEEGIFASLRKPVRNGRGILDITNTGGVPAVDVLVDGKMVPLIFSTGSRLSTLPLNIFRRYTPTGTRSDFYHGFGEFESPVAKLPVEMSGVSMDIDFGRIPESLEKMIKWGGAVGILSSDILEQFRLEYWGQHGKIGLRPF